MAEGVREADAVALTIDLDATIIASGKRECLYTYRAAEGLVRGERGYQPLVAFCPETGMVPWLEARDGNVPAATDNGRALTETLLQLPGDVRRVTLRTDGAGYQESVIRACNDPGVRDEETRRFGTIGLICGAQRSEHLMVEAARLADDAPAFRNGAFVKRRILVERRRATSQLAAACIPVVRPGAMCDLGFRR